MTAIATVANIATVGVGATLASILCRCLSLILYFVCCLFS